MHRTDVKLDALSATGIGGSTWKGIASIEMVIGGKRDDVLFGMNALDGSNGDNKIAGGLGDDFIVGGPGADILVGGGTGETDYIAELRSARVATTTGPQVSSLEKTASGGWSSSDDDTLVGKEGTDLLIGGIGDDHLFGGSGNDKSYGGPGDDTYYFEDNWGVDTLVDSPGKNVLDFSRVTKKVTVLLNEDGTFTITEGPNRLENLDPEVFPQLIGVQQADPLKIMGLPKKPLAVESRKTNSLYDLNLEDFAKDLDITIRPCRDGAVNEVIVQVREKDVALTVFGVRNITGGRGNNTYRFIDGATLPGTLVGGAPNQPPLLQTFGKMNVLDYSKYGTQISVNLTSEAVDFDKLLHTQAAPGRSELPVRESWTYVVAGLKGSITLGKEGENQRSFEFDDKHTNELDEQNFKKGMAALLKRTDFSVTKSKDIGSEITTWTVKFAEPKLIATTPVEASATADNVNQHVVPRRTPGRPANDQTWNLYTKATGGIFKLKVSFPDRDHSRISATTNIIPYNVAPDEIQEALQTAIEQKCRDSTGKLKSGLDVAPQVLVSGMGTETFPWRITFANMGTVTVETETVLFPSAASTLPAHSASGISAGNANGVTGITHVVGSSHSDRLYGTQKPSGVIVSFFLEDVALQDRNTLVLPGEWNLQTGQAVLYEALAGTASIKGLASGTVYHVMVSKGDDGTKVTFYPTAESKNPIELGMPASAAGSHQLREAFGVSGGNDVDTLIAPIPNDATALLGGDGADLLVGSNGSDFLDGGKGADTLYGDGNHDAAVGADDGQDVVHGGDGDDHVYGYRGDDHLVGGAGNDYLVGGSGSDQVEGGPGDDTLAVIERGNKEKDYDQFLGGDGSDSYVFKGEWGVASLGEESRRGNGHRRPLCLKPELRPHPQQRQSVLGTRGSHLQQERNPGPRPVRRYEDRAGHQTGELDRESKPSPGEVLTEWGFAFHQRPQGEVVDNTNPIPGNANAVLTAFGDVRLQQQISRAEIRPLGGPGQRPASLSSDAQRRRILPAG